MGHALGPVRTIWEGPFGYSKKHKEDVDGSLAGKNEPCGLGGWGRKELKLQ